MVCVSRSRGSLLNVVSFVVEQTVSYSRLSELAAAICVRAGVLRNASNALGNNSLASLSLSFSSKSSQHLFLPERKAFILTNVWLLPFLVCFFLQILRTK